MATESGAGEGQALARRLLEALDAGLPPDWDAFHSTYRHWLKYVAVLRSGLTEAEWTAMA
jgi:hypothetical protein